VVKLGIFKPIRLGKFMKINKIEVKNYRLLKSFSLDLEDELSLVIGKNNCGKTSLLTVLDKFLNNKNLTSNDFNLDYKKQLLDIILGTLPDEDSYIANGIRLRLYIEYNETDNLSNISDVMMNLNTDNNLIILNLEYILSYEKNEIRF
jgi:predicted ATP-dependent endonuclease of OLD family